MSRIQRLPVCMTGRERKLGFLYLLADLLLIPSLLLCVNSLLGSPLSSLWINFLYFALNFLFVCGIFRGFLRKSLIHAGRNVGSFLIAVLAGFLLYWLCNFAVSAAIAHIRPDFSNLNDQSIAEMSAGNFFIMAFGTVILVPVAEETLHRGLIFGTLYPKNRAAAYLLSTIAFAVVHLCAYLGVYSPVDLGLAFLQYVPAGLILAWAYQKSGSIYAPMLIHIAVNAMGTYALR